MPAVHPYYDLLTDDQRTEVHRRLFNAFMYSGMEDSCYVGPEIHATMLDIYAKRLLKEITPDVLDGDKSGIRLDINDALAKFSRDWKPNCNDDPAPDGDITQHPRAQVISQSIHRELDAIVQAHRHL